VLRSSHSQSWDARSDLNPDPVLNDCDASNPSCGGPVAQLELSVRSALRLRISGESRVNVVYQSTPRDRGLVEFLEALDMRDCTTLASLRVSVGRKLPLHTDSYNQSRVRLAPCTLSCVVKSLRCSEAGMPYAI
jgi:hypothetical protein